MPSVIPPTSRLNFIKNWWQRSQITSLYAEGRLLQRMIPQENHPHEKYRPLIARTINVPINHGAHIINTFTLSPLSKHHYEDDNNNNNIKSQPLVWDANTTVDSSQNQHFKEEKTEKNLVIMHGYGAGLGFFYKNLYALGQVPGWKVYAADWLGMGRSSRPKWTITKNSKQSWDDIVEEVEDHFVESLESWRKSVGLEKMTLFGHSLGGYFASCYSLKYPERVEKLILVSPAGIAEPPKDLIQEPPNKTPQELLENEAQEIGDAMQAQAVSAPRRKIPGWASYLWDRNISVMSIVRMTGPYGASLVNKYTSRRFAHLTTEEQHDLYDYIYHITSSTGSGEYALAGILAPGAYARKPLLHRLSKLKMPTTFIYGEEDWMDYKAAEQAQKGMSVPTKVIRIPYGGHHMYIDSPDEFNNVLIKILKDIN
ncbi:unnamed protein product [Cunninghamella blakesleeana]